ncbi:TolC family protein [Sulfurivirga sp.]|uniref:TolC family protein n=1 Tax=Sulfurivirga sp. TaxID=2614236 RepID=UPI0025F34065|nr:TolC family protein [Sulfurivirga sp.]
MRFRRLAGALLLACPMLAQAQILTFKASVERALKENPEIAAADGRIAQASAALKAAERARLPQINAELSVANTDDALNVFGMKLSERQATFNDFGANEFNPSNPNVLSVEPKNLNRPGDWTHYNAKIQLLIPIWNGGRISGFQNQARAFTEAARYGKEAVRQFLTYSVFRAYDGVHTARAYIAVARKALEAADSYVKTTKSMVEQGIVVKSELLRALVNRSEAQQALTEAENQEQLALDALRTLLALDMGESIEVGDRVMIDLPSEDVVELVSMALSRNPKLVALRKQYEGELAGVQVARAERYPHVNAMAEKDFNSDHFGLQADSYLVALQAKWKLDAGVTGATIERARARAQTQAARLQSEENQIRLKVIQAWRNWQVANSKITTTRLNEEQAEEANRLVLKRYKAGVATITELLASQAQLDKARADHVAAVYQANLYKAELRWLTGTMTLDNL